MKRLCALAASVLALARHHAAYTLAYTLGLLVILPLVAIDPAAIVLLFDVEFLMVVGTVGFGYVRGSGRAMFERVRMNPIVMDFVVGIALWREENSTKYGTV